MKFSTSIAIKLLVLISFLGFLFQFLILFNCIPYDITWGGRLKSDEQMYIFVSLGILINSFFIFTLLQKGEFINSLFTEKITTIILWGFFGLFILNTIGNLLAKTFIEKGFALITGLNSFLLWKVNWSLEK